MVFHKQKIGAAGWMRLIAVAVAILGTGASIKVYYAQERSETRRLHDIFMRESAFLYQEVEQEIGLYMDVLQSIRDLHSISTSISADDFAEFVRKGMGHQQRILGAFGFVQRIGHNLRPVIEGRGAEGGIRLLELDKNGRFVPAAHRAEYAPLTYQAPKYGLGVPLGFDFRSRPVDRDAHMRMSYTGAPAIGGDIPLPDQPTDDRYIFTPIMDRSSRNFMVPPPSYFIGYVVGIFSPEHILAVVRDKARLMNLDVALSEQPEDGQPGVYADTLHRFRFIQPVRVADRDWAFVCTPTAGYYAQRRSRQPILYAVIGSTVSILIAAILMLLAGRTRVIEQEVGRRTHELHLTNQQLQREMSERMRLQDEMLDIETREQQRVGRDLHDSVGQQLAGAVYLIRALTHVLDKREGKAADMVGQVHDVLKESVAQVRRIAKGLAPVELDEEGLPEALERLAADASAVYGVSCNAEIKGLPTRGETRNMDHLYQIAQEAVNNAVRHGKARHIQITLTEDGLSIVDDGNGFNPDQSWDTGMGLRIMRHRAELLGGELTCQSSPEGTEIRIHGIRS